MKYILLLLFTLSIYPSHLSYRFRPVKKLPFFRYNQNYTTQNYHVYKALMTGSKKLLNSRLRKVMKRYGTIHLLTPSGIHLTSCLFFLRLFSLLETLALVALFGLITTYNSYDSLERVIIFRLIFKVIKILGTSNVQLCFLITITLSFILGQYGKNALSLIYSLCFWGTIIIFHKNPLKTIFYLNVTLFFLASLSQSTHSPLSIIVNPFMTGIISFVFPILAINTIVPSFLGLDLVINHILSFITWIHLTIDQYDNLPNIGFQTYQVFIFIIINQFGYARLALLCICLLPYQRQSPSPPLKEGNYSRVHHLENFKTQKNHWHKSSQHKCKQTGQSFYCKKSYSLKSRLID